MCVKMFVRRQIPQISSRRLHNPELSVHVCHSNTLSGDGRISDTCADIHLNRIHDIQSSITHGIGTSSRRGAIRTTQRPPNVSVIATARSHPRRGTLEQLTSRTAGRTAEREPASAPRERYPNKPGASPFVLFPPSLCTMRCAPQLTSAANRTKRTTLTLVYPERYDERIDRINVWGLQSSRRRRRILSG